MNPVLPSFAQTRSGWAEWLALKRPPQPHVHQIEPTNACPYDCVMCPRGKGMNRPVGFMEFRLFERVIGEMARFPPGIRAKDLELYHFGESLLHPEIVRMTELAVRSGLQPVLSVNAPHLTASLAEGLLRTGLPRLIVSLDGTEAATFSRIRERLGSPTRIVLRKIRMRENASQEQDFVSTWSVRGFEVEIREFFPWTEPRLKGLGKFETLPPRMPCPFPWRYFVVQWNGDIVPCCRDYDAENRLGNAADSTLEEIWNGPAYQQFRRRMTDGESLGKRCARCSSLYRRFPVDRIGRSRRQKVR